MTACLTQHYLPPQNVSITLGGIHVCLLLVAPVQNVNSTRARPFLCFDIISRPRGLPLKLSSKESPAMQET